MATEILGILALLGPPILFDHGWILTMHSKSVLQLAARATTYLRCPVCAGSLNHVGDEFVCLNPNCRASFPIVNGIPVLLNHELSVFSTNDIVESLRVGTSVFGVRRRLTGQYLPSLTANYKAEQNYQKFSNLLLQQSSNPMVLVVGGQELGAGMGELLEQDVLLVESDISPGRRTAIVLDAHSIPFADMSFDGVIAQAVLEHVLDPHQCVQEIHRVLKPGGLVYAETPFMYPGHGQPYDFSRFTIRGHRRLFRHFEEVESGAVGGPGMALALSYEQFLLSFTSFKLMRRLLTVMARFTAFPLKYLDHFLADKPSAVSAATGFSFLGVKSEYTLSDRDLLKHGTS